MVVGVTHVMAFSEIRGQPVFAGAEHHLFDLMAAQHGAGDTVRLVMVVVHDGPQIRAKEHELVASGIDVRTVRHRLSLRTWVGAPARLAVLPGLVRILRMRPDDIVHTHLPQASQLGRLAAALARSRHVIDSVHNDEPGFARPSWRLRMRVLDRVTRQYIAISESVRRVLVDTVGLPAEKVHVVPYGVSAPGPEPTRAEARTQLGLPQDAFVVGFVGRLTAQKDLPVLLRAIQKLPGATCVLVGGGEDEKTLREAASRMNLSNVVFAGPRPGAAALMRAFDVFCLPSRWEGLGLVLLEAMWREVPIVATRAGAIPEVLDGDQCGRLVDIGDVDGLAAALAAVRSDPRGTTLRVVRARRRVEELYSVDRMLRGVASVYSIGRG